MLNGNGNPSVADILALIAGSVVMRIIAIVRWRVILICKSQRESVLGVSVFQNNTERIIGKEVRKPHHGKTWQPDQSMVELVRIVALRIHVALPGQAFSPG